MSLHLSPDISEYLAMHLPDQVYQPALDMLHVLVVHKPCTILCNLFTMCLDLQSK